ncbi:MAG: hypothetical protein LBD06_07995, partial [Candidatus Accumulibacter sp.]|nr:hypothetical protein [Accumulibacter sp.]
MPDGLRPPFSIMVLSASISLSVTLARSETGLPVTGSRKVAPFSKMGDYSGLIGYSTCFTKGWPI